MIRAMIEDIQKKEASTYLFYIVRIGNFLCIVPDKKNYYYVCVLDKKDEETFLYLSFLEEGEVYSLNSKQLKDLDFSKLKINRNPNVSQLLFTGKLIMDENLYVKLEVPLYKIASSSSITVNSVIPVIEEGKKTGKSLLVKHKMKLNFNIENTKEEFFPFVFMPKDASRLISGFLFPVVMLISNKHDYAVICIPDDGEIEESTTIEEENENMFYKALLN